MSAPARREQVLDVTLDIVDADGFHAATPQRVAAAAGVTRAVLYQQFGDLAGLFVALVDREAGRAAEQLLAASAVVGESESDPFVATLAAALRAIDEHPATWRLFLTPPQGAPPALHERLAADQAVMQRLLEDALAEHFPQVPEPAYVARMLHAAGRELLLLRLDDPEQASLERLTDLVRWLVAMGRAGQRP